MVHTLLRKKFFSAIFIRNTNRIAKTYTMLRKIIFSKNFDTVKKSVLKIIYQALYGESKP